MHIAVTKKNTQCSTNNVLRIAANDVKHDGPLENPYVIPQSSLPNPQM